MVEDKDSGVKSVLGGVSRWFVLLGALSEHGNVCVCACQRVGSSAFACERSRCQSLRAE